VRLSSTSGISAVPRPALDSHARAVVSIAQSLVYIKDSVYDLLNNLLKREQFTLSTTLLLACVSGDSNLLQGPV
jgi:hypothetical protein